MNQAHCVRAVEKSAGHGAVLLYRRPASTAGQGVKYAASQTDTSMVSTFAYHWACWGTSHHTARSAAGLSHPTGRGPDSARAAHPQPAVSPARGPRPLAPGSSHGHHGFVRAPHSPNEGLVSGGARAAGD
eukprot:scaffold4590_cov389-Prasinococcus_capsulatus_cf.AAC.3